MPKRKGNSRESKLLYIPFIAVIIILGLLFILPNLHPSSNSSSSSNTQPLPFFQFVKVSNEDFAPNNTVQVYLVSWVGCPYGATDSWGLYIALSKFGVLNVTPNYSDVEALPLSPNGQTIEGRVPGLIFNSFTSKSNVDFHAIYLLGRIFPQNSSASLPNGTIVTYSGNSLVNLELNELKKEAPSWVYSLIYLYQIETPFPSYSTGIAYLGHPPHLASTIIITGPKGTWMLIGYDQAVSYNGPASLSEYAAESNYSPSIPQQILQDVNSGNVPSQISFVEDEGQQIYNLILQDM